MSGISKQLKQRFGPEYWDKNGVYKIPLGFNLSLIVLLRAYIIWVFAALTWRPDLDLMSLFFPSKSTFLVSIGIGALALIPVVLLSLRSPQSAPRWAKPWRFMRWPLLLAATLDLMWLFYLASQSHYQFSFYIAIQVVLVFWVWMYLIRSKYLTCFFSDWPEPIETSKKSEK